MKVLVGVLLTLMLVSLGQARSVRPRRQWKGGSQIIDQGHIQVKPPIQEPVPDPDYVPHPEDVTLEDYSEEEDDLVKDPTWVPTEDDYAVDEGEYYDYDSYEDIKEGEEVVDDEEDKLWTSDDDPDYVPKDEDDEGNSSQQEQEVDTDNDPDWIPTEYDYHHDDYNDVHVGHDHDDDSHDHDDDPDWIPTEDDYHDDDYNDVHVGHDHDHDEDDRDYDHEDEVARLDEALFDLALIMAESQGDYSETTKGEELVTTIFQFLKGLDLSYEDVLEELRKLEQESQEPHELTQQFSEQLTQQTGSVKVKRQTKSQQQVSQFTHGQEVGQGVVPVHPQVAINRDDISSGVEPATEESSGGFFGWLTGDDWRNVVDAADKFGGTIGDTFDEWGNKISGAASDAVDNIQDVANTAGESIVSTYHELSGKIPELREKIRNLFVRFGVLVQTGADYCIQHMSQAVDQVREAEILDKLQQKVSEGNEQVIQFFQVIGQKVEEWTQTHGHTNVDEGLIILQPQTEGDDGQDLTQQQTMPNLYQDKEVIVYLDRLVTSGVITQGELETLSQQQSNQQIQQQSNQQIQQQSNQQITAE